MTKLNPTFALPGRSTGTDMSLRARSVTTEREKNTDGRLRYWLHLSQAPRCRTGFTASNGGALSPRNVIIHSVPGPEVTGFTLF